MALTATTAYDTMINGISYKYAATFTMTLPVLGLLDLSELVAGVSCDCQNNTDLPDELRAVEGESVLGGTVTLAGSVLVSGVTWPIVDLLNPDNSASPLYRHDIRGSAVNFKFGGHPGDTVEVLSKLDPGVLTTFDIDHADGTVALTIADGSAVWKTLTDVPSVVTAPPYNAGLTSEFVMDALVRSQWGDSTWPKQRANPALIVGCRASVWPEVGSYTDNNTPAFTIGKFGTALTGNDVVGHIQPFRTSTPFDSNGPWFVEFWASRAVEVNIGFGLDIQYDPITAGNIVVGMPGAPATDTVTLTVPISSAFHYIGVACTATSGGTGYTLTVYYDGTTLTSGARTAPSTFPTGSTSQIVQVILGSGAATIEALQITREPGTPASHGSFAPRAVIDPSLNPLTIVPEIAAGTDAMDELNTIAAAELGYARVDETGVFRFSNRTTLANRGVTDGTTPRVIAASNALSNLTTSVPAATGFNHIQVPYTAYAFGPAGLVWTLDTPRKIGVGQTVTWTQTVGDGVLAANMSGPLTLLPNTHSFSDGGNYYRVSTDPFGNNPNNSVHLSGTVTQLSGNTVQITFTNGSASPVYFVSPSSFTDIAAGTLSLWVGGVPVTPSDSTVVDVTYGAGDTLFTVTANPYLQDEATARTVGGWLLNQLLFAIRDFEDVDIVPDARIQIGDLIRLQSSRAKLDEFARVWGWSFSADFPTGGSGGSWTQTLNVRAVGAPGGWLGGIATRSEGGTTTWGYG